MSNPTGYSVSSYGEMITCEPRMPAYAEALRQAITPGCVVIDIGAGTGIFSLLACQYGAGVVTAIEPADAVVLLRETAKTNGYAERITIDQCLSTEHVPGQKADVIVSDIRGVLPLFEHHIATICDARERLLTPGGTLIPMRDTLFAALAQHPEGYQSCEEPWLRNDYELDLSAGQRYASNTWCKVALQPEQLLSTSVELAVLDYRTITDPNMSGTVNLTAGTEGTAHGLLIWFDAELSPGIGYSNAPGQPKLIYGQAFFPFERPLQMAEGDRIEATVKANMVDGSYVWSWTSKLFRGDAAKPELTLRQSSFLAQVMSPESLARRANNHVPTPTTAQAVDQLCLSLIDGSRSLGEIAATVQKHYPERFKDNTEALNHAAKVAGRYY
jgi:protein arginine N-methyltransferase 1